MTAALFHNVWACMVSLHNIIIFISFNRYIHHSLNKNAQLSLYFLKVEFCQNSFILFSFLFFFNNTFWMYVGKDAPDTGLAVKTTAFQILV